MYWLLDNPFRLCFCEWRVKIYEKKQKNLLRKRR